MDPISNAIEHIQRKYPGICLKLDEPMKNHTSLRIGGPVRAMFVPADLQQFIELLGALHENGITPFVMGNGTNLLFDDRPHNLVVLKTTGLNSITCTGETEISAQCGALLSKLAVFACGKGLSGLEFAHGIPGTLGGAIAMNAGAYEGEMKDVVCVTRAYNPECGVFSLEGKQHCFSYRKSCFFNSNTIVISSVMRVEKAETATIRDKMETLAEKRRTSQPLDMPSAGSTFKRPKEGYAAAMIEAAGLKGYAVGGAQVSEKHSGFIVNRGGAAFSDMIAVMEHVRETIFIKFGVELEPEIKIIGSQDNQEFS